MVTCLELSKNDTELYDCCIIGVEIIKFIPYIICMILFFHFIIKKHIIGPFLISIFFIFLTENSFF